MQVDAQVIAVHYQTPSEQFILNEGDPISVTRYMFVACGRCSSPVLLRQRCLEDVAEWYGPQEDPIILYPHEGRYECEGVPGMASRPYLQARKAIRSGLYESCVIMCRKSIEAICEHAEVTGRNLKIRIDNLKEQKTIDDKLYAWAQGLRLVGNDAAHEHDVEVSHQDARDSLAFLEALLSYVFSLTQRFEEFSSRRG